MWSDCHSSFVSWCSIVGRGQSKSIVTRLLLRVLSGISRSDVSAPCFSHCVTNLTSRPTKSRLKPIFFHFSSFHGTWSPPIAFLCNRRRGVSLRAGRSVFKARVSVIECPVYVRPERRVGSVKGLQGGSVVQSRE